MESSDGYLIGGESSVAIRMFREGYEVWLSNSRGNRYSRLHTTKNPDEQDKSNSDSFWDYSFAEMGKYDLPAVFKFISENSEFEKLTLVAHSQGTSATLYGMVKEPEVYEKYLNLFVMIGPVARLSHTQADFFVYLNENANFIKFTLDVMGVKELFQANWMASQSSTILCTQIPIFCNIANGLIGNSDPSLDDPEAFNKWIDRYPSGTSK